MARKTRGEGQAALEVREDAAFAADQPFEGEHYGAKLNEIVAHFREIDPEGWAEIALTPLQHGVEVMARKLAALG